MSGMTLGDRCPGTSDSCSSACSSSEQGGYSISAARAAWKGKQRENLFSGAASEALAAAFKALKALRPNRPIHPAVVALTGGRSGGGHCGGEVTEDRRTSG